MTNFLEYNPDMAARSCKLHPHSRIFRERDEFCDATVTLLLVFG